MGRRSITGGVTAKGERRIQFEFWFEGVRYRPTLPRTPTETNLRRARDQVAGIKARIAAGTFWFVEEFPEFRNLKDVPYEGAPRTCNQVFDAFLAHCESRVSKNDLATITLAYYRRILNRTWRPKLGAIRFLDVRNSTLVKIADAADWSKKSYNNVISVLRRAFKFGYRDHPVPILYGPSAIRADRAPRYRRRSDQANADHQQVACRRNRQELDEDGRVAASGSVPARPTRVESPARDPGETPTRGEDSPRPSLLQRQRRPDP